MTEHLPIQTFTNWLAFGERGISSEAIVSHCAGCGAAMVWGRVRIIARVRP